MAGDDFKNFTAPQSTPDFLTLDKSLYSGSPAPGTPLGGDGGGTSFTLDDSGSSWPAWLTGATAGGSQWPAGSQAQTATPVGAGGSGWVGDLASGLGGFSGAGLAGSLGAQLGATAAGSLTGATGGGAGFFGTVKNWVVSGAENLAIIVLALIMIGIGLHAMTKHYEQR